MSDGASPSATARWRRRPLVVGLTILAIVATIVVATAMRPDSGGGGHGAAGEQ